jgi:threonine dehydrogenase-like Zn-dependent dehydrogenase
MTDLPRTQYAVQLVGPDELILNKSKEVHRPGPHQLLCRVEVVGLCFSDLKLLKQFSCHVRKSEIVAGINKEVLREVPSYVPGEAPTVPGHETVVIVEAVGPGVENFKPGERYLVQTDYRWLRTAGANAAFGYNFEGALQEYVLMDERVITSPQGDSMLIPVSQNISASAVALVEPWACVEDAYASKEHTSVKAGGQMLVVAEAKEISNFKPQISNLTTRYGKPAKMTWVSKWRGPELPDAGYDDVIYFGSDAKTVEALFAKVAAHGLLNIVLCGGKFGRSVTTSVGRVHYGGIRIVGTTGSDPAESMKYIPKTDEIRPGDKINIIGAAGPMGTMHVIRNICQGVQNVSIFAADVDDERISALTKIAAPLAKKNNVDYQTYNPARNEVAESFDYTVLMAPVPDLVVAAVRTAGERGVINIFAGIPATVTAEIDLDTYIRRQLYFIGTSGSTLDDMKQVLAKVTSGRLDTNVSVAAVCGMEGATDGIRAVENRSIAGKIMVYPACHGLGLTRLEELHEKMPEAARRLSDGMWNKAAEDTLLKICRKQKGQNQKNNQ